MSKKKATLQNAEEIQLTEEESDSDVEIQEKDISVIELLDDASEDEKDIEQKLVESNGEVLFRVVFSDKEKYNELEKHVTNALVDCLKTRGMTIELVGDTSRLELCASVRENVAVEDSSNLLFSIDALPDENIVKKIPSYKRSINSIMDDEQKKPEEDEGLKRTRPLNVCFNCGGSHQLRDCPEPKNHIKINKARKQFSSTRYDRYHVDVEQRFAHLRPGVISENLRRALGIRRGYVPSFVYKMRALGYPPGWLQEAKVAHSGMNLFGPEGTHIRDSDEEDGEVDAEKDKFDIRKIISFPGFNTDMPTDVFDEYKYYGVPKMSSRFYKEEFIKSLRGNIVSGYKRKKLKSLTADVGTKENDTANTMADMDLEDDPHESLEVISFCQPAVPNIPDENQSRDSPTLEDLEAKQKKIMEALQSSSLIDSTIGDDSLIDEVMLLEAEAEKSNFETNRISTPNLINNKSDDKECVYPVTPHSKPIKELTTLGTPLIKFSPYDNLPTGEQFSVGVSDVINFENLPDSTGKYEQMKVVIKKVREKVIQLHANS